MDLDDELGQLGGRDRMLLTYAETMSTVSSTISERSASGLDVSTFMFFWSSIGRNNAAWPWDMLFDPFCAIDDGGG